VIATGTLAYANARVRALKSQLLDADTLKRLRAAGADPPDAENFHDRRFRHLSRSYDVVIRSYPSGERLCRALYRLHEIENIKLAWRAYVGVRAVAEWQSLWRPLGKLETVPLETCRDRTSLPDFVHGLRPTPYGEIARSIVRAHANDPLAAELAFDRWASSEVAAAAEALAPAEAAARGLARSLVRERDLNLLRRGVRAYRLSVDAVLGGLVLLPGEMPRNELRRLAEWTGDSGGTLPRWPKAWLLPAPVPCDWDAVIVAVKRARRRACRQAFLGSPYCLAPPLALLLLQEEEVRGVEAIAEAGDRPGDEPLLERVLAGSALRA
jgi:vacuolar-type H+-ATPase subunit C/Vma6